MHQPTPHPPPLLFLKKGDMSLSVDIAPLTSLLLGGLISLSFPNTNSAPGPNLQIFLAQLFLGVVHRVIKGVNT